MPRRRWPARPASSPAWRWRNSATRAPGWASAPPHSPRCAPPRGADLWSAARDAASALDDFARWLAAALPGLPPAVPVGPEHYQWFLREVACVPLAISEIEAVGRREYDRAVWLELVHRNRATHVPEPPLPASAAEQCRAEDTAEAQVRAFYEREDLLSQPGRLGRYLALPMPAYLEPLRFLGVADELTGPARLTENGVAYVPGPGPGLPYFYAANARDPRAGIIHEGVHYQQLALSWGNPRPLRRHYYDSGANEGIAFYNEELMLAAGLLDDAPHTKTAVCNFMRLRALRVTVDVGLATGALTIESAAAELADRVPMDTATAAEEAAFFAETPGQALTYQIGKTQLISLLADAARTRGGRPRPAPAARRHLGERQRSDRLAALGTSGTDRRAGRHRRRRRLTARRHGGPQESRSTSRPPTRNSLNSTSPSPLPGCCSSRLSSSRAASSPICRALLSITVIAGCHQRASGESS